MLIKIFGGILIVLAGLAVVICLQPDTFSYSRSIDISLPPEQVFAHVNDLRKWEAWSPWAKLDPAMRKAYEGPASGIGASYSWSGNHEVGEGRTTITESRAPELIKMKLEFIRPFKGTNDVAFNFRPEAGQTVVTWSMSGKNNFVGKAIGLFMDCEKMIHGQFDQGLSQLKAVVES